MGRSRCFAWILLAAGLHCESNTVDPCMSPTSVCANTPAEQPLAEISCPPRALDGEPTSPLDQGTRELAAAGASSTRVRLTSDSDAQAALASSSLTVPDAPESYVIFGDGAVTWIVGRDDVGAMYGAYDVAERIRMGQPIPPSAPIVATPALSIRGYNAHIVMPEDGETCWYFLDASYWRGYLDNLARARIDFLDLHGVQSIQSTVFVNALRYFATSATFPKVGVPAARRAQNLAMLQTIVRMAKARGIRVGLLSARSDLDQCAEQTATAALCPLQTPDELMTYTREAVAELARDVPDLWRIGVRIGESLEPASFYAQTYLEALHGAGPRFYTRSWLANESDLVSLATQSGDMLLEVKLSAEQSGVPYAPQVGATFGGGAGPTDWQSSYLYEGLLDGPRPFTVVIQIWNSSSDKIFRWASFDRTRRVVLAMQSLSPRIAGFSLQPAHALESQRDTFHADVADRFSTWTYARDLFEAQLYGRLGYDPATLESVLAFEFGRITGAASLWDCEQAASDIVASIVQAHTCGPDSRDFIPQLEWVGPVSFWAARPTTATNGSPITCVNGYHGPLDAFSFATPWEVADDLVNGRTTTRVSPLDVAAQVESDVARARAAPNGGDVDMSQPYTRDVVRECLAEADLGDYFAHKLRGATALAVYAASSSADYVDVARTETKAADAAWTELVNDTSYFAPFIDPYRTAVSGLGRIPSWPAQLALVQSDVASIDSVVPQSSPVQPPPASSWLNSLRPAGPGLAAALAVAPIDPLSPSWTASADFNAAITSGTVRFLAKAMSTKSAWMPYPANGSATHFTATIPSSGPGLQIAVEVTDDLAHVGWRYPDVTSGAPYVTLAP